MADEEGAEAIEEVPEDHRLADDTNLLVDPNAEDVALKKAQIAARMHSDLAKICEHEASKWDGSTEMSPGLVATLAKFITEYAEMQAKRLPDFAKHGKRKKITSEDVLLYVKPNPDVYSKLSEVQERLNEAKEAKKRQREENKAKNPTKGAKGKKHKDSTAAAAAADDIADDND